MGYLDRQLRKKLYEEKLAQRKLKEEVLSSKKGSKSFRAGQKVSYKDKEYVVKYCADGNCVIEHDDMQEFVPVIDVELVRDGKLDELRESIYQVTYSTDGVNYHSNVLVKANNEEEAKQRVISSVKVKPYQDTDIIVRERDQSFADDYMKRGMRMIETLAEDTLGRDAVKAVKRILEVGIKIADQKDSPMTMYELDKIIANLTTLKESIQSNNDFLKEDFDGEMPETPIDEKAGVTTMFHNLIEDELQAIDGYNSAIVTLNGLKDDYTDIINILTDIAGEENIHVGQLQRALELVNPQAELIASGVEEAEEEINRS